MTHRASRTVFWPGITKDIQTRRDDCATCNRHAPSLPQVPCEQSAPPSTPFEAIAADYFGINVLYESAYSPPVHCHFAA